MKTCEDCMYCVPCLTSYGEWSVCMNPDSGRMYQAVGFGDTCAEWYEYTEVNDDED